MYTISKCKCSFQPLSQLGGSDLFMTYNCGYFEGYYSSGEYHESCKYCKMKDKLTCEYLIDYIWFLWRSDTLLENVMLDANLLNVHIELIINNEIYTNRKLVRKLPFGGKIKFKVNKKCDKLTVIIDDYDECLLAKALIDVTLGD